MTAERRPPKPDRAQGMAKMQEVYNFTVDPEAVEGDFLAYTVDNLFGDVWCRPGLSVFERRMVTTSPSRVVSTASQSNPVNSERRKPPAKRSLMCTAACLRSLPPSPLPPESERPEPRVPAIVKTPRSMSTSIVPGSTPGAKA